MDKFDIQKLRALPIEGVAQRLGLKVQKHKALCPYHSDSHPSLSFSVSRNTFKCFVCDAHGSVIDLAMKVLNKPFVEACQWLANEHNIIIEEQQKTPKPQPTKPFKFENLSMAVRELLVHPSLSTEASDFLFNKRKLNPKVVQWCGLSSTHEDILIPYFSVDFQLIGIQWRYLGKDKSKPRFRFVRGSTCHIYNQQVLKTLKPNEPLFITEGCSDCWAMLSAGHKAIAIPSATLLNKKDIQILKDTSERLAHESGPLNPHPSTLNLHMYPDADIPGEKLYLQLLQLANDLGASLTRHILPPGCKDFSDFFVMSKV